MYSATASVPFHHCTRKTSIRKYSADSTMPAPIGSTSFTKLSPSIAYWRPRSADCGLARRVAIETLTSSVVATGRSMASASTATSGRHSSATMPKTSVAERCHSVSVDSTSLRDRPR
ncbi:MAG: hypothetical protein DMG04_06705 [Acidobacteria bacterium]|nr:MAG: hypothetical protein DMG04_06705 [Acidobacteriota bacterium]